MPTRTVWRDPGRPMRQLGENESQVRSLYPFSQHFRSLITRQIPPQNRKGRYLLRPSIPPPPRLTITRHPPAASPSSLRASPLFTTRVPHPFSARRCAAAGRSASPSGCMKRRTAVPHAIPPFAAASCRERAPDQSSAASCQGDPVVAPPEPLEPEPLELPEVGSASPAAAPRSSLTAGAPCPRTCAMALARPDTPSLR